MTNTELTTLIHRVGPEIQKVEVEWPAPDRALIKIDSATGRPSFLERICETLHEHAPESMTFEVELYSDLGLLSATERGGIPESLWRMGCKSYVDITWDPEAQKGLEDRVRSAKWAESVSVIAMSTTAINPKSFDVADGSGRMSPAEWIALCDAEKSKFVTRCASEARAPKYPDNCPCGILASLCDYHRVA